jgi:threonine/homoserine/homoserine lactone efflux protein
MIPATQLWVFFALVAGVVLLPGLDMAYVLASALVDGRRGGLAATAGIVAGGVVHVALGAFGLMAVLRVWPAAFNAILFAGAAYVAWIGIGLLRARAVMLATTTQRPRALSNTVRQGLLTSLLNPKAYLFTLAVFPQFLRPHDGALWRQAGVLWVIIAATQIAVYGGVAFAGDRARVWFGARPAANVLLAKSVGALLLVIAAYTAYAGWRLR